MTNPLRQDPEATSGLPPLPRPLPSPGERFSQARDADEVTYGRWNTALRIQSEIVAEMIDQLGAEMPEIETHTGRGRPYPRAAVEARRRNAALATIARLREEHGAAPQLYPGLPQTQDQLNEMIAERRGEELAAAQSVLDLAPEGGWVPEAAGSISGAITDEISVATLPLGFAGRATIGTRALIEGGLAAAAETGVVVRNVDEANVGGAEMGLVDIGAAAAGGAVLGAGGELVIRGVGAGIRMITTRQDGYNAQAEIISSSRLRDEAERTEAAERMAAGEDPERIIADIELNRVVEPVIMQGRNPLFVLDGRQSRLTRDGAEENMAALLRGPYSRWVNLFGRDIEILDAIALAGTTRETQTRNSQHFFGRALDVNITPFSHEEQWDLLNAAIDAGFTGFGVGPGALHVDVRAVGAQWNYGPTFAGRPVGEVMQYIAARRAEVADRRARGELPALPQNNAQIVYDGLIARGIDPHIAHGFLGNMLVESRLDPNLNEVAPLVPGSRGGYGLYQLTGPRRVQFEEWARDNGFALDDIDAQLDFLIMELQTSEAAAWRAIQEATTAEEAARIISQRFLRPGIPHLDRRIQAAGRFAQGDFDYAGSGRRTSSGSTVNSAGAGRAGVSYGTSRGYTQDGQVTAGDTRVEVEYQVVELSSLRQATGRLQPRDRSGAASDEQVAEIAARLDPARLLPAPEADRGAPIVGPDDIVESGNGRVRAIERAAAENPDRFSAYVSVLRGAGFDVPDDIEVPVLIGRRRTDLSDDARERFVSEANASATARMTPAEQASADIAMIDRDVVARLDPRAPLSDARNDDFVRAALSRLPQSERNALLGAGGRLNRDGQSRLQRAVFAQAFDAPDLLTRYADADAGDLRNLMTALENASPAWAQLRADIAAGVVRPEMDISGHVVEAMQIIAAARELSAREAVTVAKALEELLDDVDLLDGALSPLTRALVGKFWRNGRARPAKQISDFLADYAIEARKIGQTNDLLQDGAGPLDALRAIDAKTFGDISTIGNVRGAALVQEIDVQPIDLTVAPEPVVAAARIEAPDTASVRAQFSDLLDEAIETEDGASFTLREMLDAVDEDANDLAVLETCMLGGRRG